MAESTKHLLPFFITLMQSVANQGDGSLSKNTKEARTTRTTFTVDAEDMVELEAIASQQRVSVAWVIRDCIKEYLAGRAPLLANQRRSSTGRGASQ